MQSCENSQISWILDIGSRHAGSRMHAHFLRNLTIKQQKLSRTPTINIATITYTTNYKPVIIISCQESGFEITCVLDPAHVWPSQPGVAKVSPSQPGVAMFPPSQSRAYEICLTVWSNGELRAASVSAFRRQAPSVSVLSRRAPSVSA